MPLLFLKANSLLLWLADETGKFAQFSSQFFRWISQKPIRWRLFFAQLNSIGVDSAPIIFLVSFFTGAVFALQTGYAFRLFNAETLVGSTVGLSLTRELAPVFTALMVIARMGSSMAAELGSMRVTEQIDALETMAVNPYHYLVVPRVAASVVMMPLLTMLFNFIGMVGAYLVGVGLLDIPAGPFMNRMEYYVEPKDLFGGL
ncbi:MAG: ABC transporter permease, partial [Deltaproteobacteria bacterium]|nr:ABC transporter permease [Deltaproteobacteria bacterium]